MSTPDELDELIAAFQAEAIGEPELRRLEALLLADPAARSHFAARCREDVVLRDLCRMRAATAEPGADTRRLMQEQGGTARHARRRAPGGSGPNRRLTGGHTHRRPRRRRAGPGLVLAIGGTALALLVALLLALQARGPASGPAASPEVVTVPAPTPLPALERPIAVLSALAGRAEHYRDEEPVAARAGLHLHSGDRIRLATGATGTIALDDGSRFELAPGADVLVVDEAKGFTLLLGSGTARVTAARQPAGRRIAIRTSDGVVSVIGTAFTVEAEIARTRVAVDQGLVRAEAYSGQHLPVAAGQVAIITHGRVVYERPPAVGSAPEPEPETEPVAPAEGPVGVRDFSLLDAVANRAVGGAYDPILEGAVIDLEALGLRGISLRANVGGPVLSVRFWLDGQRGLLEQFVPYVLLGDRDGDFERWRPAAGTYLIEAQAYRDLDGHQPVGERRSLTIVVP